MYKVYTKPGCGNCVAAKQLLERKNLSYAELVVGQDVTVDMLLEIVPQATTVPQIFHNEEYVGGYYELVARLNNDDSSRLLLG
jgi:glutaredoxin